MRLRDKTDVFKILNGYENLIKFCKVNEDLYKHGVLSNRSTCEQLFSDFEQWCRSYNYYRFLYENRVVFRAQKNVQVPVDRFNTLNETLSNKVADILLTIESLRSQALVLNATSLVRSAITMATLYLRNTSVHKLDISSVLTSVHFRDDLQKFVNSFRDLRSSGRRLRVVWRRFVPSYVGLWTNMLEEAALADFYAMIHSDVNEVQYTVDFTTETNANGIFIAGVFARGSIKYPTHGVNV